MAIKEFENLSTLKFDEFTSSLIGHEEKIKDLEVNENIPKKIIALKSTWLHEQDNESSSDDNEAITLITRRLVKFLNKKRYENQRDFKGYSSKRDVINCFDYKKSIHVKYDFPNTKKKWKHDKNKNKI